MKAKQVGQQKKVWAELKIMIKEKEGEGPKSAPGNSPKRGGASLTRKQFQNSRRDELFEECLKVKDKLAELMLATDPEDLRAQVLK